MWTDYTLVDYNYDPGIPLKTYFDPYSDEYPPKKSVSVTATTTDTNLGYRTNTTTSVIPLHHPPVIPPKPSSPSTEYLTAASKPSVTLQDPTTSRKLLILDLNGTLVLRSAWVQQLRHGQPYRYKETHTDSTAPRPLRTVYRRPYLDSFINFLFHPRTRLWLDTMVWSSAQPHSVSDMVEKCFGDRKNDLLTVWARDTLGLLEHEYNRKTQTTKDLAKIWAKISASNSQSPNAMHSSQSTILLDDSPLKATLQPWNHLCIQEYIMEMRKQDIHRAQQDQLALAEREDEYRGSEEEVEVEVGAVQDEENNTNSSTSISPPQPNSTTDTPPQDDDGTPSGNFEEEHAPPRMKKRKRERQGEKKREIAARKHAVGFGYDSTLLGVIGTLDALKTESNVAGWVKVGALLAAVQKEERLLSPSSEAVSGKETNTSRMWYEDPVVMQHWVDRGIEALGALEIPVVHGVFVD